jgi:hypothetical protein
MEATKKSPPATPPQRGSQSIAQLRELQRLALGAVRLPLSRAGRTRSRWRDGQPMTRVAASFIKPNERLTSLERIEIYNRQYWYRLLDCLWDDYPGLRAILGLKKFEKLRIAYLDRYPSKSYTLRNLGSRLVQFLQEEPALAKPHQKLCLDMARFEWAQVVAFDGEAKPPLSVDDLLGKDPAKLTIALQPYITLMRMDYPLDDFVLAVKKQDSAMRGEASNAVEANRDIERAKKIRLPKPKTIHLAVHRHQDDLYYKRQEPVAFDILTRLRDGATIDQACAAALPVDDQSETDWAAMVQKWFADWMELGWICKRAGTAK